MVTISNTLDPKPVCSVCIANYNGIGVIEACIDSVLAQNFEECIEIIVHDDASTDESISIICGRYPQVRLIESKQNVGFCISNNRMVAEANGEFILLLNNDAAIFPDALATLLREARSRPEPAILGLPQYNAATNELIDLGSNFDPFLNPIPNFDTNTPQVGMVIGACFWLPKTLWEELGGFPDWFESLAEDMFLCLLAKLRGYQVKALSESGFNHWVGKSLGGGKLLAGYLSTTSTRRRLSERNKCYVMYLTYPSPFLQLILPLHLLLLIIEGLLLSAIKLDFRLFSSIYLTCLCSVWKERDRLTALRCKIQNTRRCRRSDFFHGFNWLPHKIRLLFRHGIPEIR